MFLYFHQFSNETIIMVPIERIRFLQDHKDGGALIYTDISTSNPEKGKQFRSRENVTELFKKHAINPQFVPNIFSTI